MEAYETESEESGEYRRGEMDEAQLVALIEERESRATETSSLADSRAKALDYYFGEPFGVEEPDRSQVVMREVYGVVEWMMPALMRIFFGGESVVRFTPKSREDVAQAEQETEYVNHVILEQNNGFATFTSWFKDALLSKNAYVMAYWQEKEDTTESSYSGLSEQEAQLLVQDPSTEVLEQSVDPLGGISMRVRTATKQGKVCIRPIPPERVRVEASHAEVSLRDATFVEYWETMTISALREMGFDVDDDVSDEVSTHETAVEVARRESLVIPTALDEGSDPDPASRLVKVRTVYLRVDYNGDGIAELRRVILVGREVLANDPYDIIPIAAITPTPVPHRHVGMSIAEVVFDLQEVKSMLIRGLLDNLYRANDGRWFLDVDRVDFDDFLSSRPGGAVRVEGGVANAAMPFNAPVLGAPVIQAIEYMDNVLENRTGASPRVLQGQSFDGNAINKTATGINTIMSAAMSRIEAVARHFADGVRDLMYNVHALTLKHSRQQAIVRLRGQWVPVDPASWEHRDALTVEVGLGAGDKTQQIQMLQMILTAQQSLLPTGLSDPQKLFNALSKLTVAAGFKDPDMFWNNPSANPQIAQKMQQPPPEVMAEQAKLSTEREKATVETQARLRGIEAEVYKAELDARTRQMEAYLKAQTSLAATAMSEDNKLRVAGFDVQDEPPKKRVLRHVRGPDGRIIQSEMVEE